MANERRGTFLLQIQTLFRAGTCSGLTDGQLLERYREGHGERAEAAFTALIERHGPMVLRICRAVLRDEHDAEDAFQATFLVLARKAASIRHQSSVGSWLFGVASRIACCARSGAARRRSHEQTKAEMAAESAVDPHGDDLEAIIHEEVGRLPERLRAPVVLCYFEGQTCEEAADRLGLPVGTIKSRLSGARARLHSRLTRSGCVPNAEVLSVLPFTGSLPDPAGLASSTLKSVMAFSLGQVASIGVISTSVDMLTEGVLRAMLFSKLKTAAALILAIAALAWVSTTLSSAGPEQPGEKRPSSRLLAATAAPPASEPPVPDKDKPGETMPVRGRVVGPDGQPVKGATLRLMTLGGWSSGPDPRATSGPDGRFMLPAPREAYDHAADGTPRVVATAQGFGLGWADPENKKDLTVQLVEDLPIEGLVVDPQGRPIAGVAVKSHNIWASPRENLASFIADVKGRGWSPWEGPHPLKLVTFDAAVTTGADGRFLLEGIGRERVAEIVLSGPTIASEEVYVITRGVPSVRPIGWERFEPGARSYHGARFEYTAAPTKPIIGTVRDGDTGRPLTGVKIRGDVEATDGHATQPGTGTTTDDQGRYRLAGLPRGSQYRLSVFSTPGSSYVGTTLAVTADTPALEPTTCDIMLKQGILVQGRVTDKATGRPVRASVAYYPFSDNPHLKEYPGITHHDVAAGDDGRFEIVALPGRGVLTAQAHNRRYLPAFGAETIEGLDGVTPLARRPSNVVANYHAVIEVNPAAGASPVTQSLQLVSARTLMGTVVDPDGNPIAETVAMGLDGDTYRDNRVLVSADFTVNGLDPRVPRRVSFFQVDRKLAGSVRIEGDDVVPLPVRLQPWGVVTGRIVDHQGRPQTGLVLTSLQTNRSEPDAGILPRRATVDDGGRFRFEGLVPGLKYSAYVLDDGSFGWRRAFQSVRVQPGETKDLGDIKLEPQAPSED